MNLTWLCTKAGGCGAKSGSTGKVIPEKVPGGLGAEPGQLQQAEEGSGEGLRWCRDRSGSIGLSRVMFNRVVEAFLGSTLQKDVQK